MKAKALTFLERDPVKYIDMLEPIRRGTADVVAADESGVLLYEGRGDLYLLTVEEKAAENRFVGKIDRASLVAVHQESLVPKIAERFSLTPTMRCRQAAWTQREAPVLPTSPLVIQPLPVGMAERIHGLYSHDIGLDYIRGRLAMGELFGAFLRGDLAGFAGLHAEGSMGMLEVLPPYRRQGVARQLTSWLCARQLSLGRIPFSQFTVENTASQALHERMGFSLSRDLVYWLEP